jgi:hypothetical protein
MYERQLEKSKKVGTGTDCANCRSSGRAEYTERTRGRMMGENSPRTTKMGS